VIVVEHAIAGVKTVDASRAGRIDIGIIGEPALGCGLGSFVIIGNVVVAADGEESARNVPSIADGPSDLAALS
jgi:hypothetical protein